MKYLHSIQDNQKPPVPLPKIYNMYEHIYQRNVDKNILKMETENSKLYRENSFLFFNVYLFLRQREIEREWGRGRERGRHRISREIL